MGKMADMICNLPTMIKIPALAAGADAVFTVHRAYEPQRIVSIGFIPDTVLTGADTESRDLVFINKHADASGDHEIDALVHFVDGVNIAVYVYREFGANYELAVGDVVVFSSAHVGATGLAMPAGVAYLNVQPLNI